MQQVRRIAPPALMGREAELEAFCLEEHRGPYVWWQAGPWAGKSALMSDFVLRPPAQVEGRRFWLVSFFITARLAAQDTREAFTTVLTEQLCALLRTDLPLVADESTRDATFLDLLEQAADACRQAGGRLVLVVDGLDEDRGVTTGPAAHSIAGLLPGDPPAGMRIIVAGRPNPPIPDDVPDWHPLRDPGIVRLLGQSPHAQNLERLGQRELKRLLTATPVEQDLLGLLTASRGGLSGKDLRDLTGAPLMRVEHVLHTVAGRAFEGRVPSLGGDGKMVYLLGHEELYNAARHYLDDRLAEYRDRLHHWADGYRAPGDGRPPWPAHTPPYLLTGYPRMLADEGDVDRLVALATDRVRHNRMLSISGGDTAALTEITASQDLLLRRTEPDLSSMARLSHHRGWIESRNDAIPAVLPAAWAALGRRRRAEALAYAISDPGRRTHALAALAGALANAADTERARRLVRRAETDALGLTAVREQAQELAYVAEVMASIGDHERAEQVAGSITHPDLRAQALAALAAAAAAEDRQHTERLADRAEKTARSITDPNERALSLADLARTLARLGEHRRAHALIDEAEPAAASLSDAYDRALTLVSLAHAAADAGNSERSVVLAGHAGQAARSITDPTRRCRALVHLIAVATAAGELKAVDDLADESEEAIEAVTDPNDRAWPLAYLAEALADAGDLQRAAGTIRAIANPSVQAWALTALSEATAAAGERSQAEDIARAIAHPYHQAWALAQLAERAVKAGEDRHARELADRAEQIARSITQPAHWVAALAMLVKGLSDAGDRPRAAQLADQAESAGARIEDPGERTMALCYLIEAAAGLDVDRTGELADRAEQAARSVSSSAHAQWLLTQLAKALTAVHRHRRAEGALRNMTDPEQRALALAELAETAAAAGASEQAAELGARAEQAMGTLTNPAVRVWSLALLVKTFAAMGAHEHTAVLADDVERSVSDIADPVKHVQGLGEAAVAVAYTGDHERAEALAGAVTDPFERARILARLTEAMAHAGALDHADAIARIISHPDQRERALAHLVRAVARAGDLARAESIARTITDSTQRAQALAEVAMAAGPPHAGRLLSEVFARNSWLIPLPVLAVHYPNVLRQIADAALAGLLEPLTGSGPFDAG